MSSNNIDNSYIFSATANNSPSILVNNIPPTLNNVLLVFSYVTPTSGVPFPTIQFSTNNGSSFITSGYQSGNGYYAYNSSTPNNQTITNGIIFAFQILPGSYNCGVTYIYNLNSSNPPMCSGSTVHYNGSAFFGISGGALIGTTGVNSFRILMSSGNLNTGNFKVYGLN